MIPFSNVIAGILIGFANDTWFARLIIPFIWGVIFCGYISIFNKDRLKAHIAHAKKLDRKLKWNMSPLQAFYFIEYMTAFSTSLLFSVIAGFIKGLI